MISIKQSFIKKKLKSFVRVLSVAVVLMVINAHLLTNGVHAEDLPKGSCEMTIRSDVNGWNNKANASGPCKGLVFGFYVPGGDGMPATFGIEGMVNYDIKYSGQEFTVATHGEFLESILTVHTVLVEKPAPKPEPKPAPKPDPKPAPNPAPKPVQKQADSNQESSKSESNEDSVAKAKQVIDKKSPQTEEENLEAQVLLILEQWISKNENSAIEKEAKQLIKYGLENLEIPSELTELLSKKEYKLNELISFFGQKEVMELKEFDGVRQQLLNLEKHQEVKKEVDVEEKVKEAAVNTVQNKPEKEEGFFKSVGSSISTFFKSIGTFFTNLFK